MRKVPITIKNYKVSLDRTVLVYVVADGIGEDDRG
jgi:hypothetical protein